MHRVRPFVLALFVALLALAPAAHGSSPSLVVSQVYAAGGNSGASYQNDYVELLNRGSSAVDLSGWSLQYASATSTSWSATPLSGTVQPGRYYLIALSSAGSAGAALPGPDTTGSTNLAVSGGKVAIVDDTDPLACGATVGSCSAVTTVADLVGYGAATDYEGSAPAPALGATIADMRAGGGCTDTDANAADLATSTPAPHNSSSTAAACGATGGAASQGAAVTVDVQPMLSISLEHSSIGFGTVAAGDTPAPLPDKLTVVSNGTTGYAVTVHRSAFAPTDLPLAVASSAPTGGTLGTSLGGGALARIPIAPAADLLVGTTSARSATTGDVWPASLGFASALPSVAPGHYTSTVTFTVVGR
jgi:Lamin Tail Domain